MEIQVVQRVIAGLVLSGFVFVVSGCGAISTHPTDVRNLPLEVEAKLSRGDTRQKVRSVLGKPLIDARSLGLEVYRQTGRDIEIWFPGVPIPMPLPGEKITVVVLVAYDEQDLVKEIASKLWYPGSIYGNCPITAGEYSFVNSGGCYSFAGQARSPDTLLAPAITWEELARLATTEGECAIVLLMGDCPMEEVSLDKSQIIDLSPAGGNCNSKLACVREDNNYYGTFIRRRITPGSHQLNIRQKTIHGNFEKIFACEQGETIYAELEVHTVDDWWYGSRLEGEISIKKGIPNNVVEMGELRPILWHRGTWYGPPISSP
jgi:hypothetical protein